MQRAFSPLAALLLAGVTISFTGPNRRQEKQQDKPKETKAAEESKIPPEQAKRPNPVKPTPEGLAEARRLYAYDCAMCHGKDGDGKGDLAADMKLTLLDWRDPAVLTGMTDGEIFYIIRKGRGKMLGEEDRLKETQAWGLVNVVRSFAKKASEEKPKPDTAKQ